MAAVLTEIVLDVNDLDLMEQFWSAVLELPALREDGTSEFTLQSGLSLVLVVVPEPKTVKDRLHIDLNPRGCDQAE